MKTLLILASLAFAALTYAGEPVVTITDLNNVIVDGKNAGSIAAAIANNSALAGPIQRALETFVAAKDTTAAEQLAAAQAKAGADLAASEAKCAAILAALADPATTKEDAAAEAKKSERQRKIDEATKARDDAQARLDAVTAETAEVAVPVPVEREPAVRQPAALPPR